MVRLRKVPNSFTRVTVKSEGTLNAFKPRSSGVPNALMAASNKHNERQQEPSRSATRLLSWPQVEDRICLSRTTAGGACAKVPFQDPFESRKGGSPGLRMRLYRGLKSILRLQIHRKQYDCAVRCALLRKKKCHAFSGSVAKQVSFRKR